MTRHDDLARRLQIYRSAPAVLRPIAAWGLLELGWSVETTQLILMHLPEETGHRAFHKAALNILIDQSTNTEFHSYAQH